jgi:hypothetical protein
VADLRAMMGKAQTALEAFTPDGVNGWAGKELDLQIGPRKLCFTSETATTFPLLSNASNAVRHLRAWNRSAAT